MGESGGTFDTAVRLAVYGHFVETGHAPDARAVAVRLAASPEAVCSALERLAVAHVLVLQPGSRDLWMAMPFSAVPTSFRVHTARGTWWANCAWDALGIPAMLGEPARIETTCGDCDEAMVLEAGAAGVAARMGNEPAAGDAVVHFAVPARHWWDDIGYT